MQDGVIKGTGNSRYLKSVSDFLTKYPSYEDFAKAMVAGTLPVDFNGINEAGWSQIGTALNKANLLSDETAGSYGLGSGAAPNDVLAAIKPLINAANANADAKAKIEFFEYTGTGTGGINSPSSLTFSFAPKTIIMTGIGNQALWGYNSPASAYTNILVDMSVLTEEYQNCLGFGDNWYGTSGNGYPCAKKSSDGKTLIWYGYSRSGSYNYAYQSNEKGVRYSGIAIG